MPAAPPIETAIQLHRAGRLPEAERLYEKILAGEPSNARALHLLGVLNYQLDRNEAAIDLIGKAIALKGDDASFHSNLGLALQACGRLEDAAASYGRALRLAPTLTDAHYNLGNALQELGRLDEAVASYGRALALQPDNTAALSNLGNALRLEGRAAESAEACMRALALNPAYPEAQCNLGVALRAQGKLAEAIPCFGYAIALKPDYAEAHSNLGNVLLDQGKVAQALAAYQRAITYKPSLVSAHDSFLLALNYLSGVSPEELLAAHRQYDSMLARALMPAGVVHANDRSPERRLRIGYVSPDFRGHSVAWFLEPVLRAHDREAVEIFCYAEVPSPDGFTQVMKGLADHWRSTMGLTDAAVAAQIRADAIDILVDLAGHTHNNRLLVFAHKPAPVQANWLGYPATTGLDAIDYRIVDAVTDPPDAADRFASETLLRLEHGFHCYAPPAAASTPSQPPSLVGAPVTFGSFNNASKLSDATLDCWAALLGQLPGSRLLLKGAAFRDPGTCDLYRARLVERGVAAERVELVGWITGTAEHLALYDRVDIALDPFPYNGTTTSCEALWMGVPVVALAGDRHAGRVGASLLGQIGLSELVAGTVEDYVAIAAALAADPQRLAGLRRSLRECVLAAPLCDAPGFTRRLEAAYREMWRCWCAGAAPPMQERRGPADA